MIIICVFRVKDITKKRRCGRISNRDLIYYAALNYFKKIYFLKKNSDYMIKSTFTGATGLFARRKTKPTNPLKMKIRREGLLKQKKIPDEGGIFS